MKLYETLAKQLKKENNFVTDDGELKKWVVINKAQNYDAELIALLLDDNTLKECFFKEVKNTLVFNQNLFVHFLEQKNYLNDSYTKYKNKVGLSIDGKYLKQRNEVALVWPFKDCVLEGGQSKEEDKREEIFFNETLAQDEITQLLEAKVLTKAKTYDKNGEKAFAGFARDAELNKKRGLPEDTITDNLIIKGNNLLALHSLKKEFAGKVKLIYIDPPYNTGNDSFNYNDSFNHSTWLTFMKNRLQVARELLKDDGVIFVQCDDNEQAYLKILMDEVFGRGNFVGNIVCQTNPRGRSLDKYIAKTFEFITIYGKILSNKSIFKILKNEKSLQEYKLVDKLGKYREMRLMNGNRFFNRQNRPNLWYPIYVNPNNGMVSLFKTSEFTKEVYPVNSTGSEQCWTWGKEKFKNNQNLLIGRIVNNGKWRIYRKDYLSGDSLYTKAKSLWIDKDFNHENGTEQLRDLNINFSYPKSENLLQKIIETSTHFNDIVLDFHLGSGTTGAVAHKMDRQYIGIEQMDYIESIAVERLKKVIDGEQGGISKALNWRGGGAFTYLELKKHNQAFIDQIEEAKDTDKLLVIWQKMKAKSFLSYNVDIQKQEGYIEDFKKLDLADQKRHLVDILDKNQLYVNLSSLNDRDFGCDDAEKRLTKVFYKIKK